MDRAGGGHRRHRRGAAGYPGDRHRLAEARIDRALIFLANLPPLLTYVVLGAGAAAENFVPPIPADTFVLFGAFLAAHGRARPEAVWLVTWLANVASALTLYGLSRRYGRSFFKTRIGRLILHPRQLAGVGRFYDRWGSVAIFFSRFLPGFRAVVPLFAGVSGLGAVRTGAAMLTASGLWYGLLVFLGYRAGRNWAIIQAAFVRYANWAALIAGGLALLALAWWWRTRRRRHEP